MFLGVEKILKNLNLLHSILNLNKFNETMPHDCIENAEVKSASLSIQEINNTVLKVVGPKKKFGKKTKTRKKCQLANKEYKEKFKSIFHALLLGNPLRGTQYFVCKICNKSLPYYDTIGKKMFKIEPLKIKC